VRAEATQDLIINWFSLFSGIFPELVLLTSRPLRRLPAWPKVLFLSFLALLRAPERGEGREYNWHELLLAGAQQQEGGDEEAADLGVSSQKQVQLPTQSSRRP